jgi:hypothetical protein
MSSLEGPTDLASSPRSVVSTSTTPSTYGFDARYNRFSDLLASRRGQRQDDDSDEEEDETAAESSAFTDPSSYGSPLFESRRVSGGGAGISGGDGGASGLWQHHSPSPSSPLTRKLDAYQKGIHLARRALLELDAQLDDETVQAATANIAAPRSNKSRGKQRQLSTNAFIQNNNPLKILPSYSQCPTYVCANCGSTLALQDELISKAFSGRDGKAYLFFSALNTILGPKEDRQLLTGLHTVADLSCATCQRSVGWSYIRAYEASQRYKEGECSMACFAVTYLLTLQ